MAELTLVVTGEVQTLKQVQDQVNPELIAPWEEEDLVIWDQETWVLEEWDLEDNLKEDQWGKECQIKAIQWACHLVKDLQLETLILMQPLASLEMQEIL